MTDRNTDGLVVVTGAGGFIGGHLIGELRRLGYQRARAVDMKPIDEWYQTFPDVDNRQLDLRERDACDEAAAGAREIYNLACDMGGMGFIETHKAECMISVLINTHMLMAARDAERRPVLLFLVGLRLRRRQADASRRRAAQGGGCLPGDAGGRLRLGKAVQRAHVPSFPRGLRPRDHASRAITTSTVRTAPTRAAARRRRPRSAERSSRRRLAGDDRNRSVGRRRADPQLHVHRRLPARHARADGERRHRADQHRQRRARHHQPADRHRRRDRRPSGSSGATTSTRRKACAAAAATTRSSRRSSGGRRRSGCATVSRRPTAGFTTRWRRPPTSAASTPDRPPMTDALVIALAQLNPTVGDIQGNLARIREARAASGGCDLLVCAELALIGYPPEDLVLRPAVIEATQARGRGTGGRHAPPDRRFW